MAGLNGESGYIVFWSPLQFYFERHECYVEDGEYVKQWAFLLGCSVSVGVPR